jgi:xanthine dehydrogenase accessory factor
VGCHQGGERLNGPVLREAASLARSGEPFVLATVTWARAPSSGKPGSTALVTADGRVRGWLGGACAQPTVVQQALQALADGRCRVLFLGPAGDGDPEARDGVVRVPMACASEGSMEVFVEPVLPKPQVVVIGRSPAVESLVALAGALEWRTVVVDDGGDAANHPGADRVVTSLDLSGVGVDERSFVVVATQGHYDEPALEAALATSAGYVGLVASAKRAAGVLEWLRSSGVADEDVARVHAPAGLDLGSVAHEEIAVAILAEMVATRAGGAMPAGVAVAAPETAIDPVCQMTVEVATAHYVTEHDGTPYYFCAAGCQRAFENDPAAFLG